MGAVDTLEPVVIQDTIYNSVYVTEQMPSTQGNAIPASRLSNTSMARLAYYW